VRRGVRLNMQGSKMQVDLRLEYRATHFAQA
jgi:hypothetical protein